MQLLRGAGTSALHALSAAEAGGRAADSGSGVLVAETLRAIAYGCLNTIHSVLRTLQLGQEREVAAAAVDPGHWMPCLAELSEALLRQHSAQCEDCVAQKSLLYRCQ